MAQRTVSTDLREAMKELRLGQLLPTLAERITLAEKQQLPIEHFLVALFSDEISRRHDTSAARRAASAGLDPDMIFDRWDKSAKVSLDRRVLQELMSLRFVETSRNVAVLGPVGVGKTFLACALGHLACRSAFHVRFSRADALLRLLRQSRLDNSREALMAELCAIDLLILIGSTPRVTTPKPAQARRRAFAGYVTERCGARSSWVFDSCWASIPWDCWSKTSGNRP